MTEGCQRDEMEYIKTAHDKVLFYNGNPLQ